jgi:hypothetical protein
MAGFPLDLTLGPIVIGAFFTVFFFGLICMQTISYLKKFPNDILLIKCTVSACSTSDLRIVDEAIGYISVV